MEGSTGDPSLNEVLTFTRYILLVPAPPQSPCVVSQSSSLKSITRASGFLCSSVGPGGKSLPLCEAIRNFSASGVLSSRDHFATEGEFSKCMPERNKALYLVPLTFQKVITGCFLMLYFREFSAHRAGLAHPAEVSRKCHRASCSSWSH